MAILSSDKLRSSIVRKVVVGAVVAACLPASVFAQVYNETELKAAFLYHFTSYVEHPDDVFHNPDDPFVIGILGKSAMNDALTKATHNKNVRGRPIVIKRVGLGQELRGCHMLFVPESEARSLSRILQILREAPVLVVGESQGFARRGGMIGFYTEGSRVRFEINVDTARQAGLTISSKLLGLARIVRGKDRS